MDFSPVYPCLPAAAAVNFKAGQRAGHTAGLHGVKELPNFSNLQAGGGLLGCEVVLAANHLLVNIKSWAAPTLYVELPYVSPSALLC